MAGITSIQVTALAVDGGGEKATWYRINGVTSGDTIDVGSVGGTAYKKVKQAVFFIAGVLSTQAAASISGTVLTLTLASVSNDTVYLMVIGSA